jgi:F-type H+-transporting ATPase subunit b
MAFWKYRYRQQAAIPLLLVILLAIGTVTAMAATEEHGEPASKGWVATDTYRVMNFSVLAIALFLIIRKPAAQALNGRIKGIKEQLEELEEKKKEAEAELAKYQEKISALEQEADQIVEEYIKQGKEAKVKILVEAENAAFKLEEQARKNIDHEFDKVKMKLKEDVLTKALASAEEIIKKKIKDKDQDRLIDDYLKKVVAQ